MLANLDPTIVRARLRAHWRQLSILTLVLILGSCRASISSPDSRATADLHFLRTRAGAPALAQLSMSFYAKRGEDRSLSIYYHAVPGASDSVKFLDFRVPAGALATSPDGRTYVAGDSVLITATVTDPARMLVRFEPSGLRFSAEQPAELELSFGEADEDLNDDGVVDSQDGALKGQLAVWVQESPSASWTRMSSALFLDLAQLSTKVPGFSGYAVAY
jgi:hypothetical protein